MNWKFGIFDVSRTINDALEQRFINRFMGDSGVSKYEIKFESIQLLEESQSELFEEFKIKAPEEKEFISLLLKKFEDLSREE